MREFARWLQVREPAATRALEDAKRLGYMGDSEPKWLKFLAAVEHAQTGRSAKPVWFSRRLTRRVQWHFMTQGDGGAGNGPPAWYLCGGSPMQWPRPEAGTRPRREVSADARFVVTVQWELSRRRYRVDPFPAVAKEFPEWTRERWERAVEEVDSVRCMFSLGGQK